MDKFDKKNYVDFLTGLHNRFALLESLKINKKIDVFLINIDNFSNINNLYGFEIGDEVLVRVAKLLIALKPNKADLFRFDGNEFVFITQELYCKDQINNFAESLLSFFQNTEIEIMHNKIEITIKLSISIGISSGNGIVTLKHAKWAIDELRQHSKGAYYIFDAKSDFTLKQQENMYWVNKIRHAINDEKLNVFFQPMLNVKTQKIEKYECLARIEDNNTMISPVRFMDAAKVTGTLSLVTKTMINNAFTSFSKNNFEFSINITGSDLHLGYLEDFLLVNTKRYNIDPSRVVLEILEDVATLVEIDMLNQINSLRSKGFKIAIDDFGQENSNFARLLDLDPDYLKIDGAFVKNIIDNKKSQIIVESIISTCKKGGIKVIAEHVHNEDVKQKMEQMGVDYLQGYFIGEPKRNLL